MKKLINRIFLGFRDNGSLTKLEERFVPLSQMLCRLMLEKYVGKRMENIVIFSKTQATYDRHSSVVNHIHYYRGHLTYNGLFDLEAFNHLTSKEQIRFVWDRVCDYLILAAESSNNPALADACRYAHAKGLSMDLNPNVRILSVPVELYGEPLLASVWIRYHDPDLITSAVFTLEKGNKLLIETEFYTLDGIYEFFPEWIKKIEVKNGNTIIIKGHYELDLLPLKIPISEALVHGE